MAACCGRSSRHEGNDNYRGREPDSEERMTPNDYNLDQVHDVIRSTAQRGEKKQKCESLAVDAIPVITESGCLAVHSAAYSSALRDGV